MKNRLRTCSLWYCDKKSYALGFCMGHYQNLRRHGDVIAPSETSQRTLRDMCDEMAQAVNGVLDNLEGPCPVCGSSLDSYHNRGCWLEKLTELSSRVRSIRQITNEEKAALESV